MDFFGIGFAELFFIVLLALIIFGPRDMVKAGRTMGRFLRKTVFSPTMISVQHKIRHLPYELMREAGIEEDELNLGLDQVQAELNRASILNPGKVEEYVREVDQAARIPSEWLSLPVDGETKPDVEESSQPENSILPPAEKSMEPESDSLGLNPVER